MEQGFLNKLETYGADLYAPVTFLERGVALPLTTPMLLGARVRPRAGGAGGAATGAAALELLVPNPGGGDGMYILPWNAMPEICAPSLHDRMLWAAVAELNPPSPARLRGAARQVALDGGAGRAPAAAAARVVAEQDNRRLLLHYQLLVRLVRQMERPLRAPAPESESPEGLARRARDAIALPEGVSRVDAFRALEELAETLEPVGLPEAGPNAARALSPAPLPALHRGLGELCAALGPAAERGDPPTQAMASLVVSAASLTHRMAGSLLTACDEAARDVHGLLHRWLSQPVSVRQMVDRPDWLLDGWGTILALWSDSGPAALRDVVVLLPVIPAEAAGWGGGWGDEAGGRGPMVWRRTVQANQDWQTGRILELQRRNERVRALAA